MSDNKYRKTITVSNDSLTMVGAAKAHYAADDDVIYVHKGDVGLEDFGVKDNSAKASELILVHERQHQINRHKGVGQANMSLDENYQRDVHNEITALIAEKLEIRRQYKNCKTEAERAAFFKKFEKDADNAEYINAIKSGKINPNSSSKDDFLKEMAFIKDSSIRYRADPNDDGYRKSWTNNASAFLAQRGENVKSNPQALEQEVRAMYNIGGFDFNTVGDKRIHVLDNQSVQTADNFLKDGADPQKVGRFMRLGEGDFKLAESLDVSGLSREQAEKVLQTAYVTQTLSKEIAGDLAMGETPSYDYNYIARENRDKIAVYLDMKSDIWEKNGTLSEQGDEAKFNELMKKAKEIQLDPQGWYEEVKNVLTIAKDPDKAEEFAAFKAKIKELQGKKVNFDEIVANPEKYKLPLDGTSKEEVLAEMARQQAEQDEFMREYNKNHPEKRRISDPYEVEVTDMESDILGDELKQREAAERKVEPLYTEKPKVYAPMGDGMMMEVPNPKFDKAEIRTTIDEATGETSQVALLDGQKHGAEIMRDKDGNITGYKVYDHGKELNPQDVRLDIQTKDGMTSIQTIKDGKPFGAEIVTDAQGKTKAAFYEQNGVMIEGAEQAKIEKTEVRAATDKADVAAQMKADKQKQAEMMENLETQLTSYIAEPQNDNAQTISDLSNAMKRDVSKARGVAEQQPEQQSEVQNTATTNGATRSSYIPIWQTGRCAER